MEARPLLVFNKAEYHTWSFRHENIIVLERFEISEIIISLFFFLLFPNLLDLTNFFGLRGKPGKLLCSLSVVMQFRTYNLRMQIVVLSQPSYPLKFSLLAIISYHTLGFFDNDHDKESPYITRTWEPQPSASNDCLWPCGAKILNKNYIFIKTQVNNLEKPWWSSFYYLRACLFHITIWIFKNFKTIDV